MILKLATFRGVSPGGEPLNWLYNPDAPMVKQAGAIHPKVQEWLSKYKKNKNELVVLVNALGASECWGQNVNGDIFPWSALIHYCNVERLAGMEVVDRTEKKPIDLSVTEHPTDDITGRPVPPYGYATFLQAHPFAHHKNKDASRAFGKVALSVLNHAMKRVELVVIIDKDKARQFGGQSILDRIEAGEFPDVSMGCRVPWDQCTICGNKSRTRADYCSCVKEIGMNKILDDGRQVGVINWYPRFFDISFVFIGADKTAKVMVKMASGLYVPKSVADADTLYGPFERDDGLFKAACGKGLCRECTCGCRVKESGIADLGRYAHLIDDVAIAGIRIAGMDDKKKKKKEGAIIKTSAGVIIGPPPEKNRPEHPYVGTIDFNGLQIMVENKPGDIRKGTGPGGKPWKTHMHYAYGEILGTKGTDKDRLDVYVGPNKDAPNAYIVHQNHPEGHPHAGKYDEDKAMLGFDSADEAVDAYMKHYDDPSFFRSVTTIAFPLFAEMIKHEVKGEKVAGLQKIAEDLKLEDLFANAGTARRRERTWRDEVTGKSSHHIGSGLGQSFDEAKTASVVEGGINYMLRDKTAAKKKIADIIKSIDPTGTTGQVVQDLTDREATLPTDILDELGGSDLSKVLSTSGGMGMVLKPKEFQRIIMIQMGNKPLADHMDSAGEVFPPVSEAHPLSAHMGTENISRHIMDMLMPFLEGRSFMDPVVKRRIIHITIAKPVHEKEKIANSPLLTKISAAYNWYRNELLKMAAHWDSVIDSNYALKSAVTGARDVDIFSLKTASVEEMGALPGVASLAAVPLMLLASSHLRDEQDSGEQLGFLSELLADHPYLASLGGAAGAREFFKTNLGEALLKKILTPQTA